MDFSSDTYKKIHYEIVPPLFVVVFTLAVQLMAVFGGGENSSFSLIGNVFAWKVVAAMTIWALASLWIPGKSFTGPPTPYGYKPEYKANGFPYFVASLVATCVLLYLYPNISKDITDNFPQILAACTVFGLVFCYYLWHQGKNFPMHEENLGEYPFMYEFYRGMELHPRILGVDVKQFTNCRFGLMFWQILIIVFFVAACLQYGFNFPFFVHVFLQIIYLAKFYWWETGYFNTLDMTLDRAGYYLCWGCIVWVPTLFPFVSYFLVFRKPLVSDNAAWLILMFGLIVILLNYRVDWEKERFKATDGRCILWGKPASSIKCTIPIENGKNKGGTKKSFLLTSGFWGIARHMNYTFEFLISVSWSLPAMGYGIWPYLYPIFIGILIFHRIYRDEDKCRKKYGKFYDEYCNKVPYRLIPGVF